MEKQIYKVGDKVIVKATNEVVTVRKVVKAAYYCYYTTEKIEGYRIACEFVKCA